MSPSNSQVELGTGKNPSRNASIPGDTFKITFVQEPTVFASVFGQIREWLSEPKVTVPSQYYRGEVALPATDMAPWYRELPGQLKVAFEKPRDAVGIYNYGQEEKRALTAVACAVALAAGGWFWKGNAGLILGAIAGFALGELVGALTFKKRDYPPDIWGDYRMQAGSWVNSALVHTVALTLLLLPYVVSRWIKPPKAAANKTEIVDISPYLAQLAPDAKGKKSGGGGGGGDRSPTPASRGAIPRFAKEQLAPPMAVIPNTNPQMPVNPTLIGPPELKLPQMAANMAWGDPQGVLGPPSNGPGFGGGIGSGEGGGIGSGKGGGLGPGEGGGLGGGVYSVGGSVSAPIPIYKPEPAYSEEARKAKYQGTVVLWIVVDASGNVTDCRVVKPLGLGLDEKAVETVKTWKFKAATRNGAAVPVRVMVEVSFRLF
jgi:TonB family protein